jgi:hypothetical protein
VCFTYNSVVRTVGIMQCLERNVGLGCPSLVLSSIPKTDDPSWLLNYWRLLNIRTKILATTNNL